MAILLVSLAIRLWNLDNPDDLETTRYLLTDHEDWVTSLAFSPDGSWLASGSLDRTVRLWDMENIETTSRTLNGHEGWVSSVTFSPDGRWLVSGSYDSTIRLWTVELEDLAEIGCQRVYRNMTGEEWNHYLPGQPYRKTCEQWPEGE